MKAYQITELTKEQFINELNRKGSRVEKNPIQWTIAWLEANNKPYRKFKPQNWVFATNETAEACHKADLRNCEEWLTEKVR